MVTLRLTEFAHGGGCGCKLAPSVLSQIVASMPRESFPDLLVGTETADDAAVYRLTDRLAAVATTDFFTPIVDDPYDFGRIAATNALSDIYAMGGRPTFALAILGMPVATLPIEVVQRIVAGGASVCAAAGIPVAGGHSIDTPEPIYGLAAYGLVDPEKIMRNSAAEAGDRLILTKRLGIGIFSAALKRGELSSDEYAEMLASTTQLNAVGADLPQIEGVHAVTDVTGFGLLGHALEMARGARLALELDFRSIPAFESALRHAAAGVVTGASKRNWASYGEGVRIDERLPSYARDLLCDPQTSGGLLIACKPSVKDTVLRLVHAAGFAAAAAVGRFVDGKPSLTVS